MKIQTALFASIASLSAVAAISQVATPDQVLPKAEAAAASRGAKAWADNCTSCHNMRSTLEKNDAQWAIAATHMRVRANLSGNVVDDIIVFLQSSNREPQVARRSLATVTADTPILAPGNAERGARIYGETCIACHGVNGKGAVDSVPDLTGPTGRLAKSNKILLEHIIQGYQSPGSPMPMPPKGGNPDLTDQDLADTLAYLRNTFGN